MVVVCGSPLQPLPKPSSENRLSLDLRTDPRSVGQTTVCGLCPWIEAPFTQPLTQMTADQHGSSFDPRSVGLTVGEDNLILFPTPPSLLKSDLRVKGYVHFSEALLGRLDLRLQPTDRRLTYGPEVPMNSPRREDKRYEMGRQVRNAEQGARFA
uniref:Uncharacterized protein n=1 Tax=Solanum tuberosum TaxID=4113 RepID=M1AAX3_SOLTU